MLQKSHKRPPTDRGADVSVWSPLRRFSFLLRKERLLTGEMRELLDVSIPAPQTLLTSAFLLRPGFKCVAKD